MLSHWGAKSADLADVDKFISLLSESDELTVAALCAKFSERAQVIGKSEPKTRKTVIVDEELVQRYLERLAAPGGDRARLLMVATQLKDDKSAKIGETNAIVDGYIKSGVMYSKKPEAIKALEAWINRLADTERRLQGTSGIF